MKTLHWTTAAQLLRRGGPTSGRPIDPSSIDERVQSLRTQERMETQGEGWISYRRQDVNLSEPNDTAECTPKSSEPTEASPDGRGYAARGQKQLLTIIPRPKPQVVKRTLRL